MAKRVQGDKRIMERLKRQTENQKTKGRYPIQNPLSPGTHLHRAIGFSVVDFVV